jgi:20S proteasome subunit beta 3
MERLFRMHDKLYVGLSGLATDVQTLSSLLQFRLNLYKLREERDIKPQTFATMLSQLLYGKR